MFIAACLLILTALAAPIQAQNQKPNVIYIMSDDQGWKDVGYHGSDIKTPNIDKLASGGARLEQYYSQQICTPSRAALMTGRYPFRYGLQTLVIAAPHTYGLPTDEYILPQTLGDAGYYTAIVGKWHLGHADPKYWPRQRGFNYQYGPLIGEIDYFTHEQHEGVIDWYRDNKLVKKPGYSTTLLGNDAVKLISDYDFSKQPLFLYMTFNAPHTPYQAPQEYLDMYKNISDPSRRAYAAAITAMDDQIGHIVEALDKKGVRGNTIIFFQSDNGGTRNAMFAGERATATIPCDNGPYRDGKGMLYEGGTRVIALANWPGHIKPGTTVDGMMHVVDIYPTVAAITGASTAKAKPLDGLNMWPTISEGKPSPRTEVVYNIEPFRAGIREGDWKLIWRTTLPSSIELYNIPQDPSEKNNLAAQNPEIVTKLENRANQLAAQAAKPLFLVTELQAVMKRIAVPAALPGEEFEFNEDTE
jgi:arylsulfatase A-like enzyme